MTRAVCPVSLRRIFVAAVALLALPSLASAQALSCAVPAEIARPHADTPSADTPRRMLPTASYTLAISWAPEFCHGKTADDGAAFECGGTNRFGWTLHGLWPDGAGKDWPQYCRPVELLPDATLRANLCATPSPQLMQHEWAKHGSCMKTGADGYFKRSTGLFARLHFPDMTALAARRDVTAGALATAFARANRGMTPAMLRVTVNRRGWLEEIWFCHDLRFRLTQCAPDSGGVATTTKLKIAAPL